MPGDHSAWESGPPRLLSIGELAEHTGVATTALRYYDEPALVRPAARSSGRRRHHAPSAVTDVGVILFLREVGFSLAEIRSFMTGDRESRRELVDRALAQLIEQQHRLDVARAALEHGRRCPAGEPLRCSRFWSVVEGRLHGLSLEGGHARAH